MTFRLILSYICSAWLEFSFYRIHFKILRLPWLIATIAVYTAFESETLRSIFASLFGESVVVIEEATLIFMVLVSRISSLRVVLSALSSAR